MSISFRLLGPDVESAIQVIPRDRLANRRIRNLKHSFIVTGAIENGNIVGLVFVRRVFYLVPNVTWIVVDQLQGRGIATRAVTHMLDKDYSGWFVTAICRNQRSRRVAQKSGFRLFGSFAIWIRPL